jgi:hypothetical protein
MYMPNDAKLGLVIGVGIVIALGVIFHRSETPTAVSRPRPEAAAVGAGEPARSGEPYRLTGSSARSDDGPAMQEQPPSP